MVTNSENANTTVGYRQKLASFIAMCRKAKCGDVVSIATPHTLGDSYDEIAAFRITSR